MTASGPRHLVLVGMMGSGKTTVGTAVAEHLGWPFVDSDEQVEARTGRTVREIFEADGEPAFRALEAQALAEALADERRTVVAAAGGVVLRGENRQLLRRCGTVVWLRGRPDKLAERAASGEHRPLLRDDPLGVMQEMALNRHALYEEVADAVIDVDDLEPDAVARSILELVT